MKKVVYVLLGLILVITMVAGTGCGSKTVKPAAKPPATGTLTDVNTPGEAGQDTVTINTPQGNVAVQVTPQTGLAFNGQFCTIDDLEKKISANSSYNCTIVYDDMLGALAVYVTGP